MLFNLKSNKKIVTNDKLLEMILLLISTVIEEKGLVMY